MNTVTRRPSVGTRTTTSVARTRGTRAYTRALRFATAAAERHLEAEEDDLVIDDGGSEFEDAPTIDELPEWEPGDEDNLIAPDEENDHPRSSLGWAPWVRLSIYCRDQQFSFRVHLPFCADSGTEGSLRNMGRAWSEIAQTLIATQGEALRQTTPLAALQALRPWAMKDLQRSAGQGSRDRRVVISTPFGLAPLWFFAQGRDDGLFGDLQRLGNAVVTSGVETITTTTIQQAIPHPSVKPDTIRRAHGQALLAIAAHPEILRQHRSLWPSTSPKDLLDDLGVTGRVGHSFAVATLALVGAFDSHQLLVAAGSHRPPARKDVQ